MSPEKYQIVFHRAAVRPCEAPVPPAWRIPRGGWAAAPPLKALMLGREIRARGAANVHYWQHPCSKLIQNMISKIMLAVEAERSKVGDLSSLHLLMEWVQSLPTVCFYLCKIDIVFAAGRIFFSYFWLEA